MIKCKLMIDDYLILIYDFYSLDDYVISLLKITQNRH